MGQWAILEINDDNSGKYMSTVYHAGPDITLDCTTYGPRVALLDGWEPTGSHLSPEKEQVWTFRKPMPDNWAIVCEIPGAMVAFCDLVKECSLVEPQSTKPIMLEMTESLLALAGQKSNGITPAQWTVLGFPPKESAGARQMVLGKVIAAVTVRRFLDAR